MDLQTSQTLQQIGDNFRQFSRNGRWGTCGSCPRDLQGNAYPEFCKETGRYDHQLRVEELAGNWNARLKDNTPTSFPLQDLPRRERPEHGGSSQEVLITDWRLGSCIQATGQDFTMDWGPEAEMRAAMAREVARGADVWLLAPSGKKHLPEAADRRPAILTPEERARFADLSRIMDDGKVLLDDVRLAEWLRFHDRIQASQDCARLSRKELP